MRDMMYFGNRERMTWVRAPDANYDGSRAGWDGGATTFLSGGTLVQRSTSAHRVFNYSWNSMSRNEIRAISDYADGVWGPGAIFLLDPFAMDRNILPQHWATPRTALVDAPVLSGAPRREVVEYPTQFVNLLGYPARGILYRYTTNWPAVNTRPKIYLPIPPGYTLWFGAHGEPSDLSVLRVTAGASVTVPPILSNTDDTRFSNFWNGSEFAGVEITLGANSGSSVISGMMAQVLPTGTAPKPGGFISGQGHSGLRFATQPSLTQNSVALDRQSLAVQLVEDEAWR